MRAIIVDDKEVMRDNLSSLLSIYAPNVSIVGEADGVRSGIDRIRTLKPDLVFLDVEMEDGTGFDMLSQLAHIDFKVIFVTGHDDHAIRAFKFSALDYLLKPVDPDDLMRAISKAEETSSNDHKLKKQTFIENEQRKDTSKRIVLNDIQNTYLIAISDIVRCEADINYTRFYLSDGREITVSKTLKHFDQLLVGYNFFRTHQSHLVNLEFFERLDKTEGGVVFLTNGHHVPVSTRKREHLLAHLHSL